MYCTHWNFGDLYFQIQGTVATTVYVTEYKLIRLTGKVIFELIFKSQWNFWSMVYAVVVSCRHLPNSMMPLSRFWKAAWSTDSTGKNWLRAERSRTMTRRTKKTRTRTGKWKSSHHLKRSLKVSSLAFKMMWLIAVSQLDFLVNMF